MGKIKKTNADKTQQGSNRWAGPIQSSVFSVCLFVFVFFFVFFFSLFLPRLVIRRMRKGVAGIGGGGGERGKERKEKKRKKKERGGREEGKICQFLLFF